MIRWLVVSLFVTACSFDGSTTSSSDSGLTVDGSRVDATTSDAPGPDASFVACDAWTPAHFNPCLVGGPLNAPAGVPLAPPTWDGTCVYNTNLGTIDCDAAGPVDTGQVVLVQGDTSPEIAVLYFESVTLPDTLSIRAVGSRPLVIASASSINVSAVLNVRSARTINGATRGAGALSQLHCPTGLTAGLGGGGGGGGFQGDGGDGNDGNDGDMVGGAKGAAFGAIPTAVVAGCPGGDGTEGSNNVQSGEHGDGGGALVLAAARSITVNSLITAGGMGGDGGSNDESGGGGGGSGGLIVLDAAMVFLGTDAVVVAHGGAGGEGHDTTNDVSTDGNLGQSGREDGVAALGGTGNNGGDGGNGNPGNNVDGSDGADGGGEGGGGGGGGAGYILHTGTLTADQNALVSPAFLQLVLPSPI